MQIYRVTYDDTCHNPYYLATRDEAHRLAKGAPDRVLVRVELCDVSLDKDNVVKMMQGRIDEIEIEVLRTWMLSQRGGLQDCPNGE